MQSIKLRKVGGSVGIIIPKDMPDALHLHEGDELFAATNRGGLQLTPYDPEFEASMKAFDRTRRKYRNAFHQLAK